MVAAQDAVGFDRASFGSVVLKRNQSAGIGDDIDFELSVGSYNNEAITNYSADSVFSQMGLSVGRLDILTDSGVFPCTAFIVDDKHVLTNYHCVPGILDNDRAGATRIDAVQFVAGYRQQGVEEGTKTFIVSPTPVEAHKDLDYALLEVLGNPSAEYGKLRLSDREPKDRDPYWVIGHPMGEAQRISREQCRANSPALSKHQLLHTCDTLPGNSGSPVIDASSQMVIGLHHAGSKKDSVNFAIPMRDIIQRSQFLVAALGPIDGGASSGDKGPVVDSAKDICDQLYQEAKGFGQCFGYKAYVDACGDHRFAVFAQSYINDQCQDVVSPPVDNGPIDTGPIAPPPPPEVTDAPLLRPWCGNGGLTQTEAAICDSPYLAGLDAELESIYRAQTGRSTAAEQRQWLTGSRDSCGGRESCIGQAIIDRIAYLKSPPPSNPEVGASRIVPGNYRLSDNECYITVASRPSIDEAMQFIQQWFPSRDGVRMFQSNNGYYGITVAVVRKSDADWRLNQLKSKNAVPGDSYCSSGRNFIGEVVWSSGGSGGGGGSQQVMYVDNNRDGGLNVRSGPGTNYNDFTEVTPGTALTILRRDGKWANVTLPDGRNGWVYIPLLTSTRPNVQQCTGRVVNLGPRSRSNDGFLSVRSQPSAKASKVTEVYQGDTVRVLARRDGWARLQCISGGCQNPTVGRAGTIGWSNQRYLSIQCN